MAVARTNKKKTTKKKAATKKAAGKSKTVKKTAAKASPKAKKKTAKKIAKPRSSKNAGKTKQKKASKTTARKTKPMTKKTAKKTAKKTTKKAAKKTAAKKTAVKKETTPAAKTTTKKVAKKKTAKKKTVNIPIQGKVMKNSTGSVTVQIGPTQPKLTLAPGVLRSKPKRQKAKSCSKDAQAEIRKLTKKEMRTVRELLMAKRKQLLHGMRRELADYRARSDGHKSSDEADMASDAYDESLSFEIASTNDAELQEIETALDKIEDSSYGLCEDCSAPISPSRLKILPYATLCRVCRTQKEQRKATNNTPLILNVKETDSEDTN